MPTYSYQREDGTIFEVMQRMSEPALSVCPETGQKVRRMISGGAGVVYKGEGWYVTDYKDRGTNTSSEPSSAAPTSVSPETS
jgi:putative FmdB family regulatory protein